LIKPVKRWQWSEGNMILYFLRHGLAGDYSTWHEDDRLRPLTEEGVQKLNRSMRKVCELIPDLDVILTSPLVRTRQTAEIAAEHLGMSESLVEDDRLSPGFGMEELAEILLEQGNSLGVMLVGHEPDFSQTISELIGGGRLVCKKGGLARIDMISLTPPRGELVWLIPPKALVS
jgi:phosphohistidine phosphatase